MEKPAFGMAADEIKNDSRNDTVGRINRRGLYMKSSFGLEKLLFILVYKNTREGGFFKVFKTQFAVSCE